MTSHATISAARQLIQQDLLEVPELDRACRLIVDFIADKSDDHLQHLNFGILIQISGASKDIGSQAIAYLAGDRAKILRTCFELIDDNDQIYQITADDIREARESGTFIHPDDGEPISDFEQYIYIYFTPTWLAEGAKN